MEDKKITLELTKDEFNKLQKLLEFEKKEEEKYKQKEEEKKNYNFIQLYRDHMSEMRWLMTNHQFASSILFLLFNIRIIETL